MHVLPCLVALALFAQDEENTPRPRQFGIYTATQTQTHAPTALCWTPDGLLVAESELDTVSTWQGIELAQRGRTLGERAATDAVGASLADPRGLAVLPAAKAPDGVERVFVASSGVHEIRVRDLSGRALAAFGGYGAAPGQFRDPRGLAVTGEALYVCDTGNDRVQKLLHDGRPLAQFGERGSGPAQLLRPLAIALDDAGFVYVTDSGNHRVHKLDRDLKPIKTWGDFGPHPGFFAFPDGIACHAGELFVVDTDNHRVQVFDLEGNVRYQWGLHALLPREGEGKLHYPSGIAIDPSSAAPRVWISEPQENRIQGFRLIAGEEELPRDIPGTRVVAAHYGPHISVGPDVLALSEPMAPSLVLYDVEQDSTPWEPILITRMGMWGNRPGQLRAPNDLEVDWPNKLLYVADVDAGTLSCWRFNHDEHRPVGFDFFMLKFVRSLDLAKLHALALDDAELAIRPDALELGPAGQLLVLDSLQRRVFALPASFERARTLATGALGSRPIDLAFDAFSNSLAVVDELDADVRVFPCGAGADGVTLESGPQLRGFGSHGLRVGQFLRPGGIATAPDGSVFVSDSALHRITRFDAAGVARATFGQPGLGRIEFHRPRGLDVDDSGRLWIVDWGNHRGQVLTASGEFYGAYGSRSFIRSTFKKD